MTQWSFYAVVAAFGFLPVIALNQAAPADKKKESAPSTASTVVLPPNFVLATKPEGAKSVEAAKESAKVGEQVLVKGRIGGSVAPFVEGRAMFTLMGEGLKACNDKPGDNCKTPWDYCCDTPEEIARHSAIVQVVDASGAILKAGLKGIGGMKELSEIIVQGTVKEAKDKIMIISATGVFVVKQ